VANEYCFTTRLQHDLFSLKSKQKSLPSLLTGSDNSSDPRNGEKISSPNLKQGLLLSLLCSLNEHVNVANTDIIESLLKEVLAQFAAEQALQHLEDVSDLKVEIQYI
jgi:hypothetical protein